jgi:hypothetical protein
MQSTMNMGLPLTSLVSGDRVRNKGTSSDNAGCDKLHSSHLGCDCFRCFQETLISTRILMIPGVFVRAYTTDSFSYLQSKSAYAGRVGSRDQHHSAW